MRCRRKPAGVTGRLWSDDTMQGACTGGAWAGHLRLSNPRSNHSPLEGESQKPSREAKADAVGGLSRRPGEGCSFILGPPPNHPDGSDSADRGIEMGLIDRWKQKSVNWALTRPGILRRVNEALPLGEGVDADDHLFRSLTGSGDRDLSPDRQDRAIRTAYILYKTNPLAFRLTEDLKDWVIGKGITYAHAQPLLQRVLDNHWNDWVNAWDIHQHALVRDLGLFGELCLPVFVNRADGHVRLGVLDAEKIAQVKTDPGNARITAAVVRKGRERVEARTLAVILPDEKPVSLSFGRLVGDCFYFAVNKTSTAARGTPDLMALADFLDAYDQFLFDDMERTVLAKRFIFDLTVDGADAKKLREKAAMLKDLRPGAVYAHNRHENLQAVTPNLDHQDNSRAAREFRGHIIGGAGFAEHFFGRGEDVNRATAAEMADPIIKRIKSRQRFVAHMIERVFRFVLDQWWTFNPEMRASVSPELTASDPDRVNRVLHDFSVTLPEPAGRDLNRATESLDRGVHALAKAEEMGYIDRETAAQGVSLLAGEIGIGPMPGRK